jgi:MEDS: MEthanogen/methylotroph, DcmR Sensory domain/Histidine kinase-, DNA gyrase B-, and HSP90-like ATPase/His Kinase A (phospho-acceptor) domain
MDSRLAALKQGDHICAVSVSGSEQLEAIGHYVESGLAAGERCVYIRGEHSEQEIHERFAAAGIDVGASIDSGKLELTTERETYLRDGCFDPERMIAFIRSTETAALSEGCNGLRLSGEMAWAVASRTDNDRLIDYEKRLNSFFPGSRSHAICQYNREQFPPHVIRNVLRAHPLALVAQSPCFNPYYEPPHIHPTAGHSSEHVDWMLHQLVELQHKERELRAALQERDHFLSGAVHELRMPMHGLNLALHVMGRRSRLDERASKIVSRARRHVDRLNRLIAALSDSACIRAGRLQLNRAPVELRQLAEVTVAYFEFETTHLGYTIEVIGQRVWGSWDAERVGQVLHNLLSNTIKLGAGKSIEVRVQSLDHHAELAVIAQDSGLDAADLSAQCRNGVGLGFWVNRALIEAMHGEVQVRSPPGQGAYLVMRLPLQP